MMIVKPTDDRIDLGRFMGLFWMQGWVQMDPTIALYLV